MATLSAETRELDASLLVYGAPRAGKTALLHCIRDRVAPERRGAVTPFGAGLIGAPLLDWLPLHLGTIGGWRTRVHLYAVPGHQHADATRRMLLAQADGILFAADSQAVALADGQAAAAALRDNLRTEGGCRAIFPRCWCSPSATCPRNCCSTKPRCGTRWRWTTCPRSAATFEPEQACWRRCTRWCH